MDPLKSGRYYITNARYDNRAVLPGAKALSPIVSRAGDDSPGEKWIVSRLNNGRYHIQNDAYDNYATCSFFAGRDHEVYGGDGDKGQRQWMITRIKEGRWAIQPSDSEVFWGIADGEYNTPVLFALSPTDPKNQWKFEPATV